MPLENLLRSARTPSLLIQKPDSTDPIYWDLPIAGIHHEHIKAAVNELRKERQKAGEKISQPSLKIRGLLNNVAKFLGADSYEHWLHKIEPELAQFMEEHGLRQPSDLIKWKNPPEKALTARQVADRFFCSGRPLPQRLFTGIGNLMFAAEGYGRLDLINVVSRLTLNGELRLSNTKLINFASTHRDQIVLRAKRFDGWKQISPDYLDLTAQGLVLKTFDLEVSTLFNLLGDSLVTPMEATVEIELYNADESDLQNMHELSKIFREEIERSDVGWVDVIPFNDNLIFLRGTDGRFDWVVRDQREEAFSRNDLYPIFRSDELPRAHEPKSIQAYLHYQKSIWLDQLRHKAEHHHYDTGGTVANYPGSDKLVQRYLIATNKNFKSPTPPRAFHRRDFIPHEFSDKCLMVSDLITIDEFWDFYISEWQTLRDEKSKLTNQAWDSLPEMNQMDSGYLPVCVTWFDAVAYCKFFEKKTGLPARLLTIEEWKAITPSESTEWDLDARTELFSDKKLYSVETIDHEGKIHTGPSYHPNDCTRFKKDLNWIRNEQGLEFLSACDFGEWLADYQGPAPNNVHAPVACTVSGIALGRGPLECDLFSASLTGKYKNLKVGFRLCYVAERNS